MKVFIEAEEAEILGLEGLGETTHDRDEYVVVELDDLITLGSEVLLDCNKKTGVLPQDDFRGIKSIVQGDGNAEYKDYLVEGIVIDLTDMSFETFFHTFSINIELAEKEEGFVWPDDIKADDWS